MFYLPWTVTVRLFSCQTLASVRNLFRFCWILGYHINKNHQHFKLSKQIDMAPFCQHFIGTIYGIIFIKSLRLWLCNHQNHYCLELQFQKSQPFVDGIKNLNMLSIHQINIQNFMHVKCTCRYFRLMKSTLSMIHLSSEIFSPLMQRYYPYQNHLHFVWQSQNNEYFGQFILVWSSFIIIQGTSSECRVA